MRERERERARKKERKRRVRKITSGPQIIFYPRKRRYLAAFSASATPLFSDFLAQRSQTGSRREREMSRQTRSKSSSDFVRSRKREGKRRRLTKEKRGILRECAFSLLLAHPLRIPDPSPLVGRERIFVIFMGRHYPPCAGRDYSCP